jgi:hypothetical protein
MAWKGDVKADMTRTPLVTRDHLNEASRLVDQLGVGAYRDAKRRAGLEWNVSFQRLYRLEAETVIGIMREKLNQTKG